MKALKKLRKGARKLLGSIVREIEDLALACLQAGERSMRGARARATKQPAPPAPADERTQRRMAEAEHGGVSSAESAARWARGENPGGTHGKAVRREGPERARPGQEEPPDRKERMPLGHKYMPASRRGG
jgi:hypothetical protein